MYQTIIGVLGAILFVTIVMIIYVVVVVKKRRGLNAPYLGRDDFSNASEAQCLDGMVSFFSLLVATYLFSNELVK